MSVRACRRAAVALLVAGLVAPAAALAVPAVNVSVDPTPAPAGGSASLSCVAAGDATTSKLLLRAWGGTLAGGTPHADGVSVYVRLDVVPVDGTASAAVTWTTPATCPAEGCKVTCTATSAGMIGPVNTTATGYVSVVDAGPQPVLDSLTYPTAPVLGNATVTLTAAATDPSGGAVTYAWTATGGALAQNGASATWTAPEEPGSYEVRVVASTSTGQTVTGIAPITVALATYSGGLEGTLEAPSRVAVGPGGELWVVDARGGRLLSFTARGDLRFTVPLREEILAVAPAQSAVWASTTAGQILELDPLTGAVRRALPLLIPGASGLAWEPTRGQLWIALRNANVVVVLRPDGSLVAQLAMAGATRLVAPVDVAVDASSGTAWVIQQANEAGFLAHAFDASGAYLRSAVGFGSGAGTITRAGGAAVDAQGRLYVTDVFQGAVQVFSSAGLPVTSFGEFGGGPGQLRNPGDVAVLANGDLVIANTDAARIERFGRGGALPVCAGDEDCDGLPDAWELAFGLNHRWAGDSGLDLDGDGISNVVERSLGTNPSKTDSDGDGYADGDELLAGFSPTDPTDHQPLVDAPARLESGPGLVKLALSVTSRNDSTCSAAWKQVGGDAVALRDAPGLGPSFVARKAGVYRFEAVASCGRDSAAPVVAEVAVAELPPRPEAGPIRVVRSGDWFVLDASFSSDPNGGLLAMRWDQVLGPALARPAAGPLLAARARRPGLSAFAVGVTDPAGLDATAEVPVLVVDARQPAPTALPSSPLVAQVGDVVRLDASASLWPDPATPGFEWTQLSGPTTVALDAAEGPTPSFVAPEAGHYAFEVALTDGELRSPGARVDVFVAEQGGALPRAVASAPATVTVGEPFVLDAAASVSVGGAPLAYAWRQVTGPAAGLTGEGVTADVVAFEQGYYEFELSVAVGAARSLPTRVSVIADAPEKERIVASVTGPGVVLAGSRVQLVGKAQGLPPPTVRRGVPVSRPARYTWKQVSGPWIALDGPDSPTPSFRPRVGGVYAFELVVESGGVRSAPAPVSVLVTGTEN